MKERAPYKFKAITCVHCQQELTPTSASQKYHPDCKSEIKRTRRKERYHTDSEFKERLIRSNRRSGRKSHNELATRKLIDLLDRTTRWVSYSMDDRYPLFPVEEGMVMISGNGLLLKTRESEIPIEPHDAVKNYTYKRIKEATVKVLSAGLRK